MKVKKILSIEEAASKVGLSVAVDDIAFVMEQIKQEQERKCKGNGRGAKLMKTLLSILRDREKRSSIEKELRLSNVEDFGTNKLGEYLAPFRPTHDYKCGSEIVVKLAKISNNDTVYELGSGDARMLAEISRLTGCQGIGIELNKKLVEESREMLRNSNLEERVSIVHGDFCSVQMIANQHTVVYLYVTANGMQIIAPLLIPVLKAGGRVVSYTFAVKSYPCIGNNFHENILLKPTRVLTLPNVPRPYGKYYLYDKSSL
eukprot:g4853.t1